MKPQHKMVSRAAAFMSGKSNANGQEQARSVKEAVFIQPSRLGGEVIRFIMFPQFEQAHITLYNT